MTFIHQRSDRRSSKSCKAFSIPVSIRFNASKTKRSKFLFSPETKQNPLRGYVKTEALKSRVRHAKYQMKNRSNLYSNKGPLIFCLTSIWIRKVHTRTGRSPPLRVELSVNLPSGLLQAIVLFEIFLPRYTPALNNLYYAKQFMTKRCHDAFRKRLISQTFAHF